jgi:hypothetical protein
MIRIRDHRPTPHRAARGWLASLALGAGVAATADAQRPGTNPPTARELSPLSPWILASTTLEFERYLRVLQVAGQAGHYPVSVRAYAPDEVARFAPVSASHPWRARFRGDSSPSRGIRVLPAEARVVGNSSLPSGFDEGPVWAGRGVTAAARAGVAAAYGPVTVVVAPVAFRAQNAAFTLLPTGTTNSVADPRSPCCMDTPQRFGDGTYGRVDLGSSTLRVAYAGLAVGVSSAAERWGPAVAHALILGGNGGGFPHVFVGTASPRPVGVGRLHARVLTGPLSDSPYAPPGSRPRAAAGGVVVFEPRGVDGLELGVARFFHEWRMRRGFAGKRLLAPFEDIYKRGRAGALKDDTTSAFYAPDNQLASVFARWVFPGAGLELYGEFAKNDHNLTLRETITEPDHNSAYMLGVRRVVALRRSGRLVSVSGELVNARISHLNRVREQTLLYEHIPLVQGHTHRGQLLASSAVPGGGGSSVAVDVYSPRGRWSVTWDRVDVQSPRAEGAAEPLHSVRHTLGGELLLFGTRVDLTAGLAAGVHLNRRPGRDAGNVTASFGVRWHPLR